MWRFFIWFLLPAPKVGEIYTLRDKVNDPWNTYHLTVLKQDGNWYRLGSGAWEQSVHRADLVGFWIKTGQKYDNEEAPF